VISDAASLRVGDEGTASSTLDLRAATSTQRVRWPTTREEEVRATAKSSSGLRMASPRRRHRGESIIASDAFALGGNRGTLDGSADSPAPPDVPELGRTQ
jgi:hypothetical protein